MENTILSWNEINYPEVYTRQLQDNPVWFDPKINCHLVYSYAYCKAILASPDVHVPELNILDTRLSETVRFLASRLVRVSNGDQHEGSRSAAFTIWERLFRADFGKQLNMMLRGTDTQGGFDWVEVVAKKLPILAILHGLGIREGKAEYIAANLPVLVRVMSPAKSDADVATLNAVVEEIFHIAEECVKAQNFGADPEERRLIACNLVGLFIQCYDAGRGLLCESLLNLARCIYDGSAPVKEPEFFKKLVTETLRFNPPVHNTRRVAVNDMNINGHRIRKGDIILVVLAAANLDPEVFARPLLFDTDRPNNHLHLTFGLGGHNCLAKYFSIEMAVKVCQYLAAHCSKINILQAEWTYEPQLNVRLVRELVVSW